MRKKERIFKIEGIGFVNEDYLKKEYAKEVDEFSDTDANIPNNYEDWLKELLLDPRSAIIEMTIKK